MALMDIIGLGGDKQAVIFDIGEAYTKIGFAGETTPRQIIPSKVRRLVGDRVVETKIIQPNTNGDNLYETLREFLHVIYFKYLLVNPKERKVVICESVLCPVKFRNTLAKVLFGCFDVVTVLFAPGHLLSLFTLGVPSGLVVDCGYNESLALPIYEHTPILSAMEFLPAAGKLVHKHLQEQLLASSGQLLKEDTIENIKVTCCFVRPPGKVEDADSSSQRLPPSVCFAVDNGEKIDVDGKLRANSFDILFDGDDEGKSIATCILDSLARCPIDCRQALSENLVLIGGTAMTPGFAARVLAEVKDALSSEAYKKKLAIKRVKLRQLLVQPNYAAWLGGAVYGMLESLAEYSITREKYKENPTLPDWASILSHDNNISDKSAARTKFPTYRKSALPTKVSKTS
eukprot:gene16071-17695_t